MGVYAGTSLTGVTVSGHISRRLSRLISPKCSISSYAEHSAHLRLDEQDWNAA